MFVWYRQRTGCCCDHHIRTAAVGTFNHLGYSASAGRVDRSRSLIWLQAKSRCFINSVPLALPTHGGRQPNADVVANIYGGYRINDCGKVAKVKWAERYPAVWIWDWRSRWSWHRYSLLIGSHHPSVGCQCETFHTLVPHGTCFPLVLML